MIFKITIFFISEYSEMKTNETYLSIAMSSGNLDMVKHYKSLDISPSKSDINNSAMNGHLHILDFFAPSKIYPNSMGIYRATSNGHLHIVQFAVEKISKKRFQILHYPTIIYQACLNNHMHIVDYMLTIKNSQSYLSKAIDIAKFKAIDVSNSNKNIFVINILSDKYKIVS
jgi:hypothetical protein